MKLISILFLIPHIASAGYNCRATYQTTANFDANKNVPKIFTIKTLKVNALNKFEGANRAVFVSEFKDRVEASLINQKESIIGKVVMRNVSKNGYLSFNFEVPVMSETENLEVYCTLKL